MRIFGFLKNRRRKGLASRMGFTPHPECPTRKGRDEWAFGRDSAPRRSGEEKDATAVRPRSFTIIELLIVISLLSVVSLAAYSVLSSGLKVWKKTNTGLVDEDIGIFFAKFTQDISSVIKFQGIPFLGQPERLEFCTLIGSPDLAVYSIGKAVYEYDPHQKAFRRGTADFSQIYKEEQVYKGHILNQVHSLKFTYCSYDKEQKAFIWSDAWTKDTLPAAVKVRLEIGEGANASTFTRTLCIPLYQAG